MEFLFEKPIDFKSTPEYNRILNTCKKISPKQIQQGYFYAYDYDFSLDYPKEKLSYFDEKPLDFIFTKKDSNHVYGLNFHFIPLIQRSYMLSRLKTLNPKSMQSEKPIKINFNYTTLQTAMAKSKFCVRQYRVDRISNLRIIPPKLMYELVKYQIESFYAVEFDSVVNRHRTYKIKNYK